MSELPIWGRPKLRASTKALLLLSSIVLAILAFNAFGLHRTSAVEDVPCSDPRGCPDLIVDEPALHQRRIVEETFSPTHCAVVEGMTQAGSRKLLRFTSTYPNRGPGDLTVGDPAAHPEWFVFSNCHNHYHFQEYADYRLWTAVGYQAWTELRAANPDALARDLLSANPGVQSQIVESAKRGFCVIDVLRAPIPNVRPEPRQFTSCAYQGISVGWADSYPSSLDGQWIDITNVSAGDYFLEVEVNAEHLFKEANYRNNASAINVKVPSR